MSNPFYTKTGNPASQSRGLSSLIRNEFTLIEQGFDAVAPLASPAFTGTPTAPTQATGTSSTAIATTAFVANTAMSAALPSQTGNAGKFIRTNGTNATWESVFGGYSARTSNTILDAADSAKFINITSGTFSQTLTAAATLGSEWFVYIKNSGTGVITLDPNASETIDGKTTITMYQGEGFLIRCDGTNFVTLGRQVEWTLPDVAISGTPASVVISAPFSDTEISTVIVSGIWKPTVNARFIGTVGGWGAASYNGTRNTSTGSALTVTTLSSQSSAELIGTTFTSGVNLQFCITLSDIQNTTANVSSLKCESACRDSIDTAFFQSSTAAKPTSLTLSSSSGNLGTGVYRLTIRRA